MPGHRTQQQQAGSCSCERCRGRQRIPLFHRKDCTLVHAELARGIPRYSLERAPSLPAPIRVIRGNMNFVKYCKRVSFSTFSSTCRGLAQNPYNLLLTVQLPIRLLPCRPMYGLSGQVRSAMPAAVLSFTVGGFSENPSKAVRGQGSGTTNPWRGRMVTHGVTRVDDTVLIREAQRGSRAAFEELVRQYDQAVLRLALHLTGSEADAQDVYQDAFLKAYRSVGNFRFECSFYTWLYRIVTNLCLDHLRKKQVRKEDAPVTTDSDGEEYNVLDQVSDDRAGTNPEHDLMARELGTRINAALRQLSARERMVFELKHYQGLKLRTIGDILQTTEETAKNTLFRATQKLRVALAPMR